MKLIMLLGVVMILPLTSYSMESKPKKDGYYADAGKHAGEPAAERLGQSLDNSCFANRFNSPTRRRNGIPLSCELQGRQLVSTGKFKSMQELKNYYKS